MRGKSRCIDTEDKSPRFAQRRLGERPGDERDEPAGRIGRETESEREAKKGRMDREQMTVVTLVEEERSVALRQSAEVR